ncbi:MAG: helix-turn-helix domain-containing protein [Terriglobia bacterium]
MPVPIRPSAQSAPDAPSPVFERLLDSDEAAALLKIHPKTLQRMARRGEVTAIHVGKLWRFRASALNAWLETKEQWLRQLTLPNAHPMARGTKAKTRNIMHARFNHAIRYEWLVQNGNPITRVRQSAKRQRIPDIFGAGEFQLLHKELDLGERLLVALDATPGCGEASSSD